MEKSISFSGAELWTEIEQSLKNLGRGQSQECFRLLFFVNCVRRTLLCCIAAPVFMHCVTVFDSTKYWAPRLDNFSFFRRPGCK